MSKPQPVAVNIPEEKQDEYEKKNVHEVYEVIANHFSDTRYKPWPVVENFLFSLSIGSIGADVGCGNGKYIGVNPNVFISGSDRSSNLVSIVQNRGYEGLVADGLSLPYRSNAFDFAISIAVIHHFSTPERRLSAIEEILRIVKPGGKVLIFVWALEQTKFTKRNFQENEQDVFVPWVLTKKKDENSDDEAPKVFNRYYHLFKKGELDGLFEKIDNVSVDIAGYDRDNHYVIATKLQ
ncbi:S-adenosyl-L-methionine-dependent methyltransferase [Cunninghamella echinulata]|nr:S-adenosyl-L-methionine-dependent methyltransferase [Cunninghamella echinulata]